LTLLGFFLAATTVSAQAPASLPDLPGAPLTPPPPPPSNAAPATPIAPPGTLAAPGAAAGGAPAAAPARAAKSLNLRDAPIDQVLEIVADLMGRTLIKSPGVNATVTLKSNGPLTVEETLQAIDAVLAMNNVTLVPMGEKFLKVVVTAEAGTHNMPIKVNLPGVAFNDDDKLISQVVQLKYIEIAEAQPILDSLKRAYGKIQALERTNSLLITDTQSNLKRMLEILEYLDQPAESQVETRIYELRYAESSLVAGRLNELIADSQSKEDKPRVEQAASAAPTPPTPPGVIRAPRAGSSASTASGGGSAQEQASRGIIRGKVKIIADERTNIIFVISRPENFAFFDQIVAVLDRPVESAIGVRVVPLEYAKAEDIASILNEFIGAASAEKGTKGTANAGDAGGTAPANEGRSTELRDFLLRQTQTRLEQAQTQLQQADGKGTIGRLSPSTKILADKRTNALLLMGRKGDLDALELVLDGLDIMLAQVLIETVILEVNLGDTIETGFDWLQRSVVAYNEAKSGPGGGVTVRTPAFSFGGGSVQESGSFRAGDSVTRSSTGQSPGGLTYFATFNDLNLDTIVRLAGSSSDARVVATPVVMTTDNTEAKIVAAEQRPVVTANSIQTTGQQTQNFEYRTIGINITVTPRINPSGFVMMEIQQSADDVLGETTINNTTVPIISKRELSAQVGVQSRKTVVLGGLVRTDNSK
jgi:general secretion pathway protein D